MLLSACSTFCAAHSTCCMVQASLSSLDKSQSSIWCPLSVFAAFLQCSLHVLHSGKPMQSGSLGSPIGMWSEGRVV